MRKILLTLLVGLGCMAANAQSTNFCGEHKMDSIHHNEVEAYTQLGTNILTNFYGGLTGTYTHHFDKHWAVDGGMSYQFKKRLLGLSARGRYHFNWTSHSDFYVSARFLFNRYFGYSTNELIGNVSVTWETSYFNMTLGESYIHFNTMKAGYTEPLTLTFGIGVNIRRRNNPWNIGLFFRNYDDFYYENWNINWGLRFYSPIPWVKNKNIKLFGEFNVRPAGSMSQLATKYEGHLKLGIKHVW